MKAVRIIVAVLTFSVVFAALGGETKWIGGASGNWNDASWSNGAPTADDVAVFELSGDVAITIPSGSQALLQGLKVAGNGVLEIRNGGNGIGFGKDANGECTVDVAESATVVVVSKVSSASVGLMPTFVKTGAGIFRLGDGKNQPSFGSTSAGLGFNDVEVRDGTFGVSFSDNSDAFNPGGSGRIHVCSGAKLAITCHNWLVNWGWIDVDEGGLCDFGGKSDLIGGLAGSGEVTNVGSKTGQTEWLLRLSLKHGPYAFTGKISGRFLSFEPFQSVAATNTTARSAATADAAHFILSPETLAGVTEVRIPAGAEAYTNIVKFAAGYPANEIYDFQTFTFPTACPQTLEDEEGNPVTVRGNLRSSDGKMCPVNGSGNLINLSGTTVITNGIAGQTGFYGVAGGSVVLGDGIGSDDANPLVSKFCLTSGTDLRNDNVVPGTTDRISGSGRVYLHGTSSDVVGGATWTIGDLSLTNGTIYSDRAFPHFVINGGISTNVTLDQTASTGMVLTINGGFLHVNGGSASGSKSRQFYQTGGCFVTERPISGWGGGNQDTTGSNNEIFYHMTGGRAESYMVGGYCRGLGAELCGNAHMLLRSRDVSLGYHRLASDGFSYQLKVADNAVLDVDSLNFATGANKAGYHGYLWLNGGTFSVGGNVYMDYSAASFASGFDGRVYYNGGLVKSLATSNKDWYHADAITGYICAGGLRLETSMENPSGYVRFLSPLIHDPDTVGEDGGIVKTGRGALVLHGSCTYTGPTRVLGGTIRNDGASASTPFGLGSVEIEEGALLMSSSAAASVATADGKQVAYRGSAVIGAQSSSGCDLTCGPLVRQGRGVLFVASPSNALTPGDKLKVRTTQAPTSLAGGLPEYPVFSQIYNANYECLFGFLTYNADTGFVPAACAADFSGGANALVQISASAISLSADARAAGLDLRYRNSTAGAGGLKLADGVTLKIGSDIGYAPVLMSSVAGNSVNCGQSIEGGTLDFGAAEGIIAGCQSHYYGQIWQAAGKLKCVLAGTGGITFAGGLTSDRRAILELHGRNEVTGGVTVESVFVKPMVAGALSADAITVYGNAGQGGGIWVPAESAFNEISNALSLSGRGTYAYVRENQWAQEPDMGALCVDRSVTVSGDTTLASDTRISARLSGTCLDFTGRVSGAGALNVAGTGLVRLAAGNTYTGGTVIEGSVEVTAGDALGTGPIALKKGGRLCFANSTAITVENDISGEGEIVFAGTAPVIFAGANAFSGTTHYSGGLSGSDVSLDKKDEGLAFLTATNTYGGSTKVEAGTLVLGVVPPQDVVPFFDDVTARFDASAEGCVLTKVFGEDLVVTNVFDADGRQIRWANETEAAMPKYVEEGINGMPTVFFDGRLDRLVSTTSVRARAVFIVFRTPAGSKHPVAWDCAGLFGYAGKDNGIRLSATARTFQLDGWLQYGDVWLNGDKTETYAAETAIIGSFLLAADRDVPTAVGNYWGANGLDRTWWGDVAEVICYDRMFSDDERLAVEDYLAAKWGVDLKRNGKFENVIPTASPVTVSAGASIDLAGSDQRIALLSGEGSIVNTSEVQSRLTFGDGALDGFAGLISGGVLLVIDGTLVLDPSVVRVDPSADLRLQRGSVLDLNGGTLVVRNASGTGYVINGTLVVRGEDRRKDPGMLLLIR